VITADTKNAAIAHTKIYDFCFMLDVEQLDQVTIIRSLP